MAEQFARLVRGVRAIARRPGWLVVITLGLALSGGLLAYGALKTADGPANAALNMGTSMLGAMITVAIIGPIIRYVQEGTVREHRRLDYGWFGDQVSGARQQVQILTTFSNMLKHPNNLRFDRDIRAALANQAQVSVLLLDPRSLAVDLRQRELAGGEVRLSVQRAVMENIRILSHFTSELRDRDRARFQVRLYDASASITLYRWDERALVSFLPIGRFSELGPQLEVTMRSPLGEFLQQRFEELWEDRATLSLADFMELPVTLVESGNMARRFRARYVEHERMCYIVHTEILAAMARRKTDLRATLREDTELMHDLVLVDSHDGKLHDALRNAFLEKYDVHAHTFVGLHPASS